jgi:hypothetical protein
VAVVRPLEELVPESQREAAVEVLRKFGHLTDAEGWADISPALRETLESKPAPFLAALSTHTENE